MCMLISQGTVLVVLIPGVGPGNKWDILSHPILPTIIRDEELTETAQSAILSMGGMPTEMAQSFARQ